MDKDFLKNIDENGNTPLIIAVYENRMDLVRVFLYLGANPNLKNNNDTTALMIASQNNQVECTYLLLHYNADIHIQDTEGNTALMYASVYDSIDIIKLLINKDNQNLDQINENGWTALLLAASMNNYDIVYLLLQNGVDINKQSNKWDNLLKDIIDDDSKEKE